MTVKLQPKAVSEFLKRQKERTDQTNKEREEIVNSLIACVPPSFRFYFEQRRDGVKEIVTKGNSITYIFPGDFPFREAGPYSFEEVEKKLDTLRKAWKGIVNIISIRKNVCFEVSFEAI